MSFSHFRFLILLAFQIPGFFRFLVFLAFQIPGFSCFSGFTQNSLSLFWDNSHIAQAGFEVAMELRITLSSLSSYLPPSMAWITGLCLHAWLVLIVYFFLNSRELDFYLSVSSLEWVCSGEFSYTLYEGEHTHTCWDSKRPEAINTYYIQYESHVWWWD